MNLGQYTLYYHADKHMVSTKIFNYLLLREKVNRVVFDFLGLIIMTHCFQYMLFIDYKNF